MTSSLTTRLHGNYLFSAEIKTFEMPAQKQQRGITICWRGKPPAKRHSISIPLVTENWPTGSSCRSWPWSLVGALDFGFLHLAFQLQQIQCDLDLID